MSKGGIRQKLVDSIREVVFGMEDALVSTLGALTGIAIGSQDGYIVILSGIVLIFVEALSMSAGSYLSSKSAHQLFESRRRQERSRILQERIRDDASLLDVLQEKNCSKKDVELIMGAFERERKLWVQELRRTKKRYAPAVASSPAASAVVMGAFYLFGGIFPLMPYFFLPVNQAIAPSIVLAGIVLFVLGIYKARVTDGHALRSGLEMTAISLTAALLGFAIGRIVSLSFGVSVL